MQVRKTRDSLIGATLLGLATAAAADVVVLTPVKDTTLIEENPTYSNGSGSNLFIGAIASGANRRALLKFDVAAAVPAGADITAATVRFDINRAGIGSGTADSASLHKLVADWGEGASATSGGGGTQATPEDATWTYRFYGNPGAGIPRLPWLVAGADFAALPSASITVGSLNTYEFSNTAQLVADVEAWLATPASNHGWILIGPENGDQTARRIDSRESASIASRPTLTVTFTPAPPADAEIPLPLWSLGLLAASFAYGGLRTLRRRQTDT